MRKEIVVFLFVLIYSSFVLAAGSEIDTNFVVGDLEATDSYVAFGGVWLWVYLVLVLVILTVVYFVLKRKEPKKVARKPKKKVTKKKKVARKKK